MRTASAQDPAALHDAEFELLRARATTGTAVVLAGLTLVSVPELGLHLGSLFWSLRLLNLAWLAAFLGKRRLRIGRSSFERLIIVECGVTFLLGGWGAYLRGDAVTGPYLQLILCYGAAMTLPWGPLPQAVLSALDLASWALTTRGVTGTWTTLASPFGMAMFIGSAATVYVTFMLTRHRRELAQKAAELALARDEALASSRAKSEFLANMSHEIRTPMNGVLGMASVLQDSRLTAEQQECVVAIRNSGEALLTIINDILDHSKIEAGKVTIECIDFDLRTTMEEVAEILGPRAREKGLELICSIPPALPDRLRGDPHRLRQVLINLAGNAIKFTEHGHVVLQAELVAETASEATVRLAVADTGIGIAKHRQAAVFESFTQADGTMTRRYGGTGLGLTISRRLIDLMGGTLGLESEPGRGSTFWCELRLEKQAADGTQPLPPAALRGVRVLVVDDNATNRAVLRHQLTAWGFRLAEAGSGPDALALLRAAAASDPFRLVLLDMQMPDVDGVATANAVKGDATIRDTPLVMLSSMDVPTETTADFAAVLLKPCRQAQLFRTLLHVLNVPLPGATAGGRSGGAELPRQLGLHVLVAEDNPVNQLVATRMLERMGCRADVVANGREAVDAVAARPYDLVLMDVQMPEMDGIAATAEIRRREAGTDRHIPIVALTAHAMGVDVERCLEAGMDGYLAKPILAADLARALVRHAGGDESAPAVQAAASRA